MYSSIKNQIETLVDNVSIFLYNNPLLYKLKYFIYFLTLISVLQIAIKQQLLGKVPTKEELSEYQPKSPSNLITFDGVNLGTVTKLNKDYRPLSDFPQSIINALISIEDVRFYKHDGIDYFSMGRVLFKSLLLNKNKGGGSTITQQVAKNLYPREKFIVGSLFFNKLREWIIAFKLEEIYTKSEILQIYLNDIPFSGNCIGASVVARRFFNKDIKDIDNKEAAVIIGMLASNTKYNPRINPDRALIRRNIVLSQMHKRGFMTDYEYHRDIKSKIDLNNNESYKENTFAAYYKQIVIRKVVSILETYKKANGDKYNIYKDNLKIITSLDATIQQFSEDAVNTHMSQLQTHFNNHWLNGKWWTDDEIILRALYKVESFINLYNAVGEDKALNICYNQVDLRKIPTWINNNSSTSYVYCTIIDSIKNQYKQLNTGLVTMCPKTGKILSWVGGINYNLSQYDNILAEHQVGSTFKPIVYLSALERGYSNCDYISNEYTAYTPTGIKDGNSLTSTERKDNKIWAPKNADGDYSGSYSLEGALTNSINVITGKLIYEVGVKPVIKTAERLGLNNIKEDYSIALGSSSFSLFDMLKAYSILATNKKIEPVFIVRILTANNQTLYENETYNKTNKREVFSQNNIDKLRHMMQSVVKQGTAQRLSFKENVAAKTGTTQNNADGWFIGYTPDLIFGTWVGGITPMVHFRTLESGQASRTALPNIEYLLSKLFSSDKYKYTSENRFKPLSEENQAYFDCPMKIQRADEINQIKQDSLQVDSIQKISKKTFWDKLFH